MLKDCGSCDGALQVLMPGGGSLFGTAEKYPFDLYPRSPSGATAPSNLSGEVRKQRNRAAEKVALLPNKERKSKL